MLLLTPKCLSLFVLVHLALQFFRSLNTTWFSNSSAHSVHAFCSKDFGEIVLISRFIFPLLYSISPLFSVESRVSYPKGSLLGFRRKESLTFKHAYILVSLHKSILPLCSRRESWNSKTRTKVCWVEMDGTFDDEAEQAVTIGEYLDEVEERELVSHFVHSCCTFISVWNGVVCPTETVYLIKLLCCSFGW